MSLTVVYLRDLRGKHASQTGFCVSLVSVDKMISVNTFKTREQIYMKATLFVCMYMFIFSRYNTAVSTSHLLSRRLFIIGIVDAE